jgi:hypothetical protein
MVDTTCFSAEPYFPKMLIVLLRQPDKTFKLSTLAIKLFGNCNWGVQGKDPYDGIVNRNGTLDIKFLTGGTQRNSLSYYFRYQDHDWYLIGAESYLYWVGHTDSEDAFYNEKINLVTGIRESYNEDEKGKKRSNYEKKTFEKKRLVKLSQFTDDYSVLFSDSLD